ncbi:hypothetical protein KSP40_PGU015464 [Platanthera guangdongensis]|uniref:Uncharacterized protein n=1 Tax=Platanthera guangdongensis TaxID=2320717 RepID=A0ABR2ME71_9ASPA
MSRSLLLPPPVRCCCSRLPIASAAAPASRSPVLPISPIHGSPSPPFLERRMKKSFNRSFKSAESRRSAYAFPSTIALLPQSFVALRAAIPMPASISILLWTTAVNAGFLSGFSGLESVPGPQLPEVDFLKKWNDENPKKYAEFDSRFRSSNVLKDLLEKSKLNKERSSKIIQRLYALKMQEECVFGAQAAIASRSLVLCGFTEKKKTRLRRLQ